MILVTGANGVVGFPLLRRLKAAELPYTTVSRTPHANIEWNLEQAMNEQVATALQGVKSLLHCAPIWLLPAHIVDLKAVGISRLVVFSSTSVISKQSSPDVGEQGLVDLLTGAESALTKLCDEHAMSLTILRPAMIYGYGRDQNIMQIAGWVRRLRFMPLITNACGLRQPVHSDDLAIAALNVLQQPLTAGKIYNLAGAETLTYRDMVERIFAGLGKSALILPLPLPVYRLCLRLAAQITGISFNPEMADRMREDLNYDYSAAVADFNFDPQHFLQHPERDLTFETMGVTKT